MFTTSGGFGTSGSGGCSIMLFPLQQPRRPEIKSRFFKSDHGKSRSQAGPQRKCSSMMQHTKLGNTVKLSNIILYTSTCTRGGVDA
jgi:hypothetical protein